jgi:poly(A) polymerase
MLKGNLLNLIKKTGLRYKTKIYLVGGPLRDKLLGSKTQDLDIVVEKNIKEIGKDLASQLGGKFLFYQDFNTGTIELNKLHLDIAQTRKEIYSQPAVLPKVFPSNIVSDLYRRDFTINAMAKDLISNELIDPYNGLADLKKGIIRVLHPKSFIDDPTRIFRAIRFAERLGFTIEPNTLKWLREVIKEKKPSLLSGERILNELRLIMQEPKSQKMLEYLNRERIFDLLFAQQLKKTFFNEYAKVAKTTDSNLKLIHLLTQLSVPKQFPLTRQQVLAIQDWKRYKKIRRVLSKASKPSQIYKILRNFSEPALKIAQAIENQRISRKINKYLNKYNKVKIKIGGDAIKQLGIAQGAIYSELLDSILFARLDGKIKNKSEEIRYLKTLTRKTKKG